MLILKSAVMKYIGRMEAFWCDVLELSSPPSETSLRRILGNDDEERGHRLLSSRAVFPEDAILDCKRLANALVVNSIFTGLTTSSSSSSASAFEIDGMGHYRHPFPRALLREDDSSILPRNRLLSFKEAFNNVVGKCTLLCYATTRDDHRVMIAERLYNAARATLSESEGGRIGYRLRMKRAVLKRIVARIRHSDGGNHVDWRDEFETLPLHVAYVRIFMLGATSTPRDFYAVQRNGYASSSPSEYPSVMRLLHLDSCGQTPKSTSKSNEYMTRAEYVEAVCLSDGYFLRMFVSPRKSAWLDVTFAGVLDEMALRTSRVVRLLSRVCEDLGSGRGSTLVTYTNLDSKTKTVLPARLFDVVIHLNLGRISNTDVSDDRKIRYLCIRSMEFELTREDDEDDENDERDLLFACRSVKNETTTTNTNELRSVGNMDWWDECCTRAIRGRIVFASTQADDNSLIMTFNEFVVRYVWKKRTSIFSSSLSSTSAVISPSGQSVQRDVCYDIGIVAIDNRRNPSTVMSVLAAHANLDTTTNRSVGVFVFCGCENESYMKRELLTDTLLDHSRVHVVHLRELDDRDFGIERYNEFLKGSAFWGRLNMVTKTCLIVQDDGVLVRRGAEKFADLYDYVGAPWATTQTLITRFSNPQMVGNGGLSLRRVSTMLKVCRQGERDGSVHDLFFNKAQPLPEDVYLSNRVYSASTSDETCKVAPREDAIRFSSEQVLCAESLGFHKPWAYHRPEAVSAFFTNILATS